MEEMQQYCAVASTKEEETSNGCFECNICLDVARDAVVTLCGHLYCWPCIYTWLHVQSAALSPDEPPTCPVCKSHVSHTAMVPLYSRPNSSTTTPASPHSPIPPRPSACGALSPQATTPPGGQRLPYRNPYQSREIVSIDDGDAGDDSGNPRSEILFGGLVYAYPSAYRFLIGGRSPLGPPPPARVRRQEMNVDKSLNRVSIFLFCCLVLCLVVF